MLFLCCLSIYIIIIIVVHTHILVFIIIHIHVPPNRKSLQLNTVLTRNVFCRTIHVPRMYILTTDMYRTIHVPHMYIHVLTIDMYK